MEVLIQGLEFTNQLQLLLFQNRNYLSRDGHFEESALDLTTKIFQSFTVVLSLLNTSATNNSFDCGSTNSIDGVTSWNEVLMGHKILSSDPVITAMSSSDYGKNTRHSGESKNYKGKIPGSSTDELKVGCKRRKRTNPQTWVTVAPTPVDDGHAWRKYGQKAINRTEYPRSYYRCTHRNEQGCEAAKQVQKIQNKPSMYQTTYMGEHTCKEMPSMLETVSDLGLDLDENDQHDSACVINFQTSLTTKQPSYTFSSSSLSNRSVKDEMNQQNTEEAHQHGYSLKSATSINEDLTMSEFLLLADLMASDP